VGQLNAINREKQAALDKKVITTTTIILLLLLLVILVEQGCGNKPTQLRRKKNRETRKN
jgi:hypothetical protein